MLRELYSCNYRSEFTGLVAAHARRLSANNGAILCYPARTSAQPGSGTTNGH